MLHAWLLENVEPEKRLAVTRALTGELGQYKIQGEKPEKPTLRPPPWTRLKQADIARMAKFREAVKQAEQQP